MQSAKESLALSQKVIDYNIQKFPPSKGYIIDMYVADIIEKINIKCSIGFTFITYDFLEQTSTKNIFNRICQIEQYHDISNLREIIQTQVHHIIAQKFDEYEYSTKRCNDVTCSCITISWKNCKI